MGHHHFVKLGYDFDKKIRDGPELQADVTVG